MFSLDTILFKGGSLISKNQMMEELAEYDNLIKAMAALFFTSKRMGETVPCIFQAWKEHAFECRAQKIRTLLSNEKRGTLETTEPLGVTAVNRGPGMLETKDFSQRMILKGLSSATEAAPRFEEDIPEEDLDFMGGEEYVRVQNINNHSYSIIPFGDVRRQDPDSQYYEEEDDREVSIEENKRTIGSKPSVIEEVIYDENDPCVQNERLLEKYAQMLGGGEVLENGEDDYGFEQ